MKAKGNRIQMSEWLELVKQVGEPEKVPAGFKTMAQIADEIGKSYPRTSAIVRQLMKRGLVEKRTVKVQTESHGIYPVPHYKPAQNALN